MLKKIQTIPKTPECFRALPDISERVQMNPSRSEQVPARLRTYENFEKLAKTSRKLRETRASAVVDRKQVHRQVRRLFPVIDALLLC